MEYPRSNDVGTTSTITTNTNRRKRKLPASDAQQHLDNENQQPIKRNKRLPSSNGSLSVSSDSTTGTLGSSSSTSSPSLTSSSSVSGSSISRVTTRNSSSISPQCGSSSSDCYGSTVDYDLLQLGSPPDSVPVCDEALVNVGQRTPYCQKSKSDEFLNSNQPQKATCIVTPSTDLRLCPLPQMTWADRAEIWKVMCRKDDKASLERDPSMLKFHPGLQARMRAILLDWLIEVCEVYKLHRETYYLAVDYLDRFLSNASIRINKTHLQLIGITCLFIAAKVEEIYPPKIGEFAYVTDSACTEEDIIQQEMILLKALNWQISPVTTIGWLSIYMQVNTTTNPQTLINVVNPGKQISQAQTPISYNNQNSNNFNSKTSSYIKKNSSNNQISSDNNLVKDNISNRTKEIYSCKEYQSSSILCHETEVPYESSALVMSPIKFCNRNDDAFIYPQFSGMEFAQAAQLIDLCTLDVEIANFSYSVVAAAAMYHTFDRKTATQTSGLEWEEIETCVKWMEPFYQVICEDGQPLFLLESNEQIQNSYGLQHVCPRLNTDESHILQTHTISLALYEKVMLKKEQLLELKTTVLYPEVSPAVIEAKYPDGLLTPPASSRKPLDNLVEKDVDEQQT